MKLKILLISFVALIMACGSEQDRMKAEIEALQESIKEGTDSETIGSLVEKYQAYVAAHPEDSEQNSLYLYRAAALQYRLNRFSGAIELLNQAIKDYYSSANTPNSALLLGSVYEEKLRNTESALTVYQCISEAFPDGEKAAEVATKLPADLPPAEERIRDMGMKMFNDSTGRIEYRVANDFITSCEIHAMLLPASEKSPELLHKAGEIARSVRAYQKALEIYEWICRDFPDYERASQALFLRAFTLDNDLKQFEEA